MNYFKCQFDKLLIYLFTFVFLNKLIIFLFNFELVHLVLHKTSTGLSYLLQFLTISLKVISMIPSPGSHTDVFLHVEPRLIQEPILLLSI